MAKKILIMGIHDAMGGVEQVIYDYISRINNDNLEFAFASMHDKIVYQDEYEKMGCRMYKLPNVKKNPVGYVRTLMKIIKREKTDILHYNMLSAANILPLIIAKLAGCQRIAAHSHNTGTVGLHKYILHYINRILIPLFATHFFICSDQAGRFMFGRRNRSVLIRNAVDVKKFSYDPNARKKIRAELKIDGDTPLIGHVGRFAEAKNHPFLIEIFSRIAQKHKTAKMLLVGVGHMETEIRRLADKYGLADRVVFYGISPRIQDLYSAMDVFVLPSFFEGLSMVGTEAQSSGLFVIASDTISKQMDIVGQVKWRSLKDSPEIWAETALECAAMRKTGDMSQAIGKAGYDIDIEVKRLEQLYVDM
ncbi:MAG: glycosyltransferase [Chitinispirillia bacterium]|nr:glycosyltransferase [Chitinispirillia bacterium]